jgi:hypothetical protein
MTISLLCEFATVLVRASGQALVNYQNQNYMV